MRRGGTGASRDDGERGLTLVELTVTLAIMGIAVVGLFAALQTFVTASANERAAANLDGVLHTYSEALVAAPYVNCAASYPTVTLPAGYAFTSGPSVRYWNGDNPATFGSSCSTDNGAQQITATVQDGATGATQQVVVAKTESG